MACLHLVHLANRRSSAGFGRGGLGEILDHLGLVESRFGRLEYERNSAFGQRKKLVLLQRNRFTRQARTRRIERIEFRAGRCFHIVFDRTQAIAGCLLDLVIQIALSAADMFRSAPKLDEFEEEAWHK